MSRIILDFGSGNTCKNDWDYAKHMIDELKAIDTGKHEIIIKWQLFEKAGENIPLDREIFTKAYFYASQYGYQTTASVFDKKSLDFLLGFDPCFVKIANNRKFDHLIDEIPRKIPVIVSIGNKEEFTQFRKDNNIIKLFCVSKYPAYIDDYREAFGQFIFCGDNSFSDHTTNFGVWYRYQPQIIEWHYKLEDSTGLDAGDFARTPTQLAEIL